MQNLGKNISQTLQDVARIMADARDDWWIIGSAAVALHGAILDVADVDVMLSVQDADRMFGRANISRVVGSEHALFRSERFGIYASTPLMVEFMAGFCVSRQGKWEPVALQTRQKKLVNGAVLWVPEREELMVLLHHFSRPKDLARAKLLQNTRNTTH